MEGVAVSRSAAQSYSVLVIGGINLCGSEQYLPNSNSYTLLTKLKRYQLSYAVVNVPPVPYIQNPSLRGRFLPPLKTRTDTVFRVHYTVSYKALQNKLLWITKETREHSDKRSC